MFETRGRRRSINIWPGFVDALATLLLVFVFMLSIFMIAQHYLSSALTGSEAAVRQLQAELRQLADVLAMERGSSERLRQQLAQLNEELSVTIAEREQARAGEQASGQALEQRLAELERLNQDLAALQQQRGQLEAQAGELATRLERSQEEAGILREQRERLSATLDERQRQLAGAEQRAGAAEEQLAQLNRQLAALREQLTRLSAALEVSESTVAEQRAEIDELGRKLNLALVEKVQELNRYRSEFFGRLREVLGEREDIRVVGDRFVFQSELLFASASAELGEPGRRQLAPVAAALQELAGQIPADIDWVLQVEGHTDVRPINTAQFPSNWELSTARANSIVHYLIERGIPPQRLAAAGFAEFDPVDPGATEAAFRRNRRIELKLTSR